MAESIQLELTGKDTGYVRFPTHAGSPVRQVRLIDILPGYQGPELIFDFNSDDVLIGIEVLAD